ncbi:MAG TPA: YggS family pyridoxal phosphate enzyme, partial [Pirellulales bacterium]|nr:YggS family pyridoxal phosphate enzyme [Pirellulales bacterium]
MNFPPWAAARLAENLAGVRQRMAAAASASGRQPNDVTLVAVTKYTGVEVTQALVEAGCHDLGESRPQELWTKAEALAGKAVRWHLVGHLQRNKLKRTLPLVSLIHSCDSLRLLAACDGEARALDRRLRLLLEVNISGDGAKHGFAPAALKQTWESALECQQVEICGLMAMAALEGDQDRARREFAALRTL